MTGHQTVGTMKGNAASLRREQDKKIGLISDIAHHPEQYPWATDETIAALRAEANALGKSAGIWEEKADMHTYFHRDFGFPIVVELFKAAPTIGIGAAGSIGWKILSVIGSARGGFGLGETLSGTKTSLSPESFLHQEQLSGTGRMWYGLFNLGDIALSYAGSRGFSQGLPQTSWRRVQSFFAPLLEKPLSWIGRLPSIQRQSVGKPLGIIDRTLRFFLAQTTTYPKVGEGFVGRLLQKLFPDISWEQGHVFVQQSWFGRNGWYPNNPDALRGLKRIGDAGMNLIPLPREINNQLGKSAGGTFALAFGIASKFTEEVNKLVEGLKESMKLIPASYKQDRRVEP